MEAYIVLESLQFFFAHKFMSFCKSINKLNFYLLHDLFTSVNTFMMVKYFLEKKLKVI